MKRVASESSLRQCGSRGDFPSNSTNYKLIEEIGSGATGAVWKGLVRPFNDEVAVKVMNLDQFDGRDGIDIEEVRREVQIQRICRHPSLISIDTCFVDNDLPRLWIVMKFLSGGSVASIIQHSKQCARGFDEASVSAIALPVVQALHYLHEHGHIHRDIKASNILIDMDGRAYLSDFGVSAFLVDSQGARGKTGAALQCQTFVGTPAYMAPEVIEESGYDTKADIWSLGITMLELCHGVAPHAAFPPLKILMQVLQGPPPRLNEASDSTRFSADLADVIAWMLQKDPAKRPTCKELLAHPFFKTAEKEHRKDAIHCPGWLNLQAIVRALPPLGERFRNSRSSALQGVADALPQGRESSDENAPPNPVRLAPTTSSSSLRGTAIDEGVEGSEHGHSSGWDFDVEDLKAEAALLPDE